MNYEIRDCIDAGTDYCPCHLSESGDCIICSQLSGKTFCDCINWKGVCIYQEFQWNGCKAKEGRKTSLCKIIKKEKLSKKIMLFTILVPHQLAKSLVQSGSYIFMRNPKTTMYYDAPISIMDVDLVENTLTVAIEIKGIKTKMIDKLEEEDKVLIRGPYWNGDLGIKNIQSCKEQTAVLICRGIGQAPMIPVLKELYANGNKIIVILDKGRYENIFIQKYLEMCNATVINSSFLNNGELTEELKTLLTDLVKKEKVGLVHSSCVDILNSKILEHLGDDIKFSCCNNAKMCCGEGVCGACSTRYKGNTTKKLCKVQIEPKFVFKDRRLI